MEFMLKCNTLKCRKELGDRALVTTCSHIFCTDCASGFSLTSQGPERRNECPACGSHLMNPDDAVVATLNPSEDYKTSVLSGLSPNIVMECASRALSFWAYQATQEVVYQEYLCKNLTDKYSGLSVHLDQIVNEANSTITNLQSQLQGMKLDQDNLRRKNEELAQAYKDKNRKLLQTQELYDKLKRKAMLGQVQDAAADAVDSTLSTPIYPRSDFGTDPTNTSLNQQGGTSFRPPESSASNVPRSGALYSSQTASQPHFGFFPKIAGAQRDTAPTPSTHRQRLGDPTSLGLSTIPGLVTGASQSPGRLGQAQAPLGNMPNKAAPRFGSVGLSSSLKAGHGTAAVNELRVPSSGHRARVIQRPTPAPGNPSRIAFGH